MVRKLLTILISLISIGTSGYMIIENWSFLDSIYMTVITLTTTGFQEVHPLSSNGKIFTALLLIGGVGLLTFVVTNLIQLISEGEYKKRFGRKKMEKRLSSIKKHNIVCGFGKMGMAVCEEFEKRHSPFIVVESNEELTPILEERNYPYVLGDASNEDVLIKAKIEQAKSLISIVSTDAQNVYTILTARELRRDIYIVSRATGPNARKKILNTGASEVICPYAITSTRIAKTILDPASQDFINFTLDRDYNIGLSDIIVHSTSPLVGKTIQESEIRKKGIIIVGIKQKDGEILFAPSPKRKIVEDERIIALGPREAIRDFNSLVL